MNIQHQPEKRSLLARYFGSVIDKELKREEARIEMIRSNAILINENMELRMRLLKETNKQIWTMIIVWLLLIVIVYLLKRFN